MTWNRGAEGRKGAADGEAAKANSGTIQIRTGAPNDPDSAATGTLLGTLTMSATAFGNAADDGTNATSTANAITDDSSADATGTAGHFRVLDSGGTNCVGTGTITATSGGGDMEMNNISITSGGTISISAFTLKAPQV